MEFMLDVLFAAQSMGVSYIRESQHWIGSMQERSTTSFWRVMAFIIVCFVLMEAPSRTGGNAQDISKRQSRLKSALTYTARTVIRLTVTGALGLCLTVAVASSSRRTLNTTTFTAASIATHLAWLFPLATMVRTMSLHTVCVSCADTRRGRSQEALMS